MAFATEHPIVAHSEYRPVTDILRTEGRFEVVSQYEPAGDQPGAIAELERRVRAGEKDVVLLGATGTGKSATTAWLIERLQRPTLVMAPNKTLAAQLANELREMLPHNAVEYFVSYYDYYQPEAYIAQTDTYIEKDSSINDDVERLRHSATSNLLSRRDVVVVASVSCIYGLGTPQSYLDRSVQLDVGLEVPRDALLRLLVDMQYNRNDMAFTRFLPPSSLVLEGCQTLGLPWGHGFRNRTPHRCAFRVSPGHRYLAYRGAVRGRQSVRTRRRPARCYRRARTQGPRGGEGRGTPRCHRYR
ncbi:UvrABC system protein B (UvrB protein) excinuclease [Mycobacteroides abscessus subsp. abscessus]|nr:UvrABC system protein B (UvrB protein) excinuclease [Mycobacteroides abscessus subsp. abscessus]